MTQSVPSVPTFDVMLVPTIQALQLLGGSGTVDEIYEKVTEILALPDEVLDVLHGTSSRSEVEYRLAWSRTYLKKFGLIQNSKRGVWSLVSTSIDVSSINPRKIVKSVRAAKPKKKVSDSAAVSEESSNESELIEELEWHQQLHQTLLNLAPDAFERLAQRLLRESGFTQVHVTGKSGDGGIDGVGIARMNGFLSFHVLFQCKRYQGAVGAGHIRDFRGAMQGRSDKGLFITTGTFTRDAIKEATRDGAPPIDLIDGEELIQRLKELELGVKVEMIESIEVNTDWFKSL